MSSPRNALAVFVSALATVAALLAATPAQAATAGLAFASNTSDRTIAVYGPDADSASHPLGSTVVRVKCNGSKTCTGWASFQDIHLSEPGSGGTIGEKPATGASYKVAAGATAYIKVWLSWNQREADQALWDWETNGWAKWGPSRSQGRNAVLRFAQAGPSKAQVLNNVILTQRVANRALEGHVSGDGFGTSVTQVKVTRWTVDGLQAYRAQTVDVDESGYFSLGQRYQLGPNNSGSSHPYRLSISATVNGHAQQWFWRGNEWGDGYFNGGSTEVREASPVRINRDRDFQANFKFGTISGQVANGSSTSSPGKVNIRVAGAPVHMPSSNADKRDLDLPYCANDFGSTKTDATGRYAVHFLPTSDSGTDRRFMVKATPANGNAMGVWNNVFSTCLHTRLYTNSTANLLVIPTGGSTVQNFTLRPAGGVVDGQVHYSGFSPTYYDRHVTLREFIPGRAILDSPVVRTTQADASAKPYYKFSGVKPGKYWVESGRRTSCSSWLPSIYPNNNAYLEGADRGAERWKTVEGKYPEYQKSYDYGYTAKTPPSGHRGWMYRPYCGAVGAGTYTTTWVSTDPAKDWNRVMLSERKGATISGHVSRGNNANKEYMVTAYSTGGKLVLRSAITNGSGNFTIRGLQSGSYHIAVNTDSWRGNARTFRGTKTKSVSAGNGYSVGTLKILSAEDLKAEALDTE